MKGLLLKDLYTTKATIKIYAIILLVYRVIGAISGNMSILFAFHVIAGTILPMTAIAYDERCSWDKYACVSPVNRTQVAISKYIFSLLAIAGCSVFSFIAFIVSKDMSFGEFILTLLSVTCCSVIYMSIIIPMIYKFGSEKSRLMAFRVILIPVLLFMAAVYLYRKLNIVIIITPRFIESLSKFWPVIMVILSLVILAGSMALSVSIYKKKDF